MELLGKTQQLEERTHVLDEYKKLFTAGIRKRIETGTKSHLEDEDISFCVALESMGPKAYKYMRTEGFPFPSPSTLNSYAAQLDLQPGFLLEPVLSVLSSYTGDLDKWVCIYFDEMKIRRCYEYDHTTKSIVRPADQALVVMVKGLCKNYQQVIYYDFDKTPSIDLIELICNRLEKCGLRPIALVSDQGTKNMGLWKAMNVSMDNPVYILPSKKPLFVLADTPHLIKNLRINFLDYNFTVTINSGAHKTGS